MMANNLEAQKPRKLLIVSVLISSLLISSIGTSAQSEASNPPRKILTGWIPYYGMKTSLPAALNNTDLIKEVMPFWYTMKTNSKTNISSIIDLYTPGNPSVPVSVPLAAMRSAGLTIIPSITDGNPPPVLEKLLASDSSRAQIVSLIVNFVEKNNFDGIDLDFETFGCKGCSARYASVAPNWIKFITSLGTELRAKQKILSVTSFYQFNPTDRQKGYWVYSWAAIAPFIDRLRIMTYDYSVASIGPIGPLSWIEKTVQYAVSVMPSTKVFIGLPGYGRDWVSKVDGICGVDDAKIIKAGAKAGVFVMRDAASKASALGATPIFNEQFGEMTYTYQRSYPGTTAAGLATTCTATRTVWYQDSRSFSMRAALVPKYKLGGLTQWTLGMEDPLAMQAIRDVASNIAPDIVSSSIASDLTTTSFASPITVSSEFTLSNKSPVAGLQVRLEAQNKGETTWREIYLGNTGVDGKINVSLVLARPSTLRFRSEGSWERGASITPEIKIELSRLVALSVPTSLKRNESAAISGVVQPRAAGISVTLQIFSGGVWRNLGEPVITDAQGNFNLTLAPQARGVTQIRAVAASDSTWPSVTTSPISIIIR